MHLAAFFDELEKIAKTVLMQPIPPHIKKRLDAETAKAAYNPSERALLRSSRTDQKLMNRTLSDLPLVGASGEAYEEALPKHMQTGGGQIKAEHIRASQAADQSRRQVLDQRLSAAGKVSKLSPGTAEAMKKMPTMYGKPGTPVRIGMAPGGPGATGITHASPAAAMGAVDPFGKTVANFHSVRSTVPGAVPKIPMHMGAGVGTAIRSAGTSVTRAIAKPSLLSKTVSTVGKLLRRAA